MLLRKSSSYASQNEDQIKLNLEWLSRKVNLLDIKGKRQLFRLIRKHHIGKTSKGLFAKQIIKSPEEKALELTYKAYGDDVSRDEAYDLVKQALSYDPDNVRALMLLARLEEYADDAIDLYKKAINIARKKVDETLVTRNSGRPAYGNISLAYIDAREEYARFLFDMNQIKDCIKEFNWLVDMDPGDHGGNRFMLSTALLKDKQFKALRNLLDKYEKESSAYWLFNKALFCFLSQGKNEKSDHVLNNAYESNNHVIEYLLGIKKVSAEIPQIYQVGDETEAIEYFRDAQDLWQKLPTAMRWLKEFANENGLV